ncbi:chaperone protein DnaJ 1, mitochondrial isoform X1, partial [Tanacetum coccineum]
MAKKYHPDANENKTLAKIKFQEIRDSYEVYFLLDFYQEDHSLVLNFLILLLKMVKYRFYKIPKGEQNMTRDRDTGGLEHEIRVSWDLEYSSFQDVFSAIKRETEACQAVLSISFMEAARGCSKDISFSAKIRCGSC